MDDIGLYQQILGLAEPWQVKQVSLNREARNVEIQVECTETVWACPECSQRMHVHRWETRRWRHLDSCQFKTIIVADVPQVRCEQHGVQTVVVPWAEKYARFTRLFERLAIDVMKECSISAACDILRISWDEAERKICHDPFHLVGRGADYADYRGDALRRGPGTATEGALRFGLHRL